VDVDAALAVRHGQARLGAQERLILDPQLVDAGDGDHSLGVRIAVADDHVPQDVRPRVVAIAMAVRPGPVVNRLLLRRTLEVDDRLQLVVGDADPLRCAAGLLRMLGGDDRDRLAEVAHAVEGEHGLVGELEPVALLPGHVLVRQHRVHTGHRQRPGTVELQDSRVRVRAAERVAPEHARRVEVARVRELAGRLRDRVDALRAQADAAELELAGGRGHVPAASRTASKIFA
jgi:hypothetical protein